MNAIRKNWIGILTAAIAVISCALAWRFTPLAEFIDLRRMLSLIREFARENPYAPALLAIAIGAGNLVMIPINLLLLAVALAFPGWKGFFCGMAGAVLAAVFGAWFGRWVGAEKAHAKFGERFRLISEEISDNGISAVIVFCWVPIAPNIATNVIAGICRLPYWKLVIGTIIGFLPGLIVLNLLGREMRALIDDPSFGAVLGGFGLLGLVALAHVIGKRYQKKIQSGASTAMQSVPQA